jgi:transposase
VAGIGRRGAEKKAPAGEPPDHALGRSQGGFGTKLHLICDGAGTPLAVAVSPGQEHETQRAIPPLAEALSWPIAPAKLAGDKGYSAGWLRQWLVERGIKPVIAHQKKEPGRQGRPTARRIGGGTSSSGASVP